jgi:hypothetical protein
MYAEVFGRSIFRTSFLKWYKWFKWFVGYGGLKGYGSNVFKGMVYMDMVSIFLQINEHWLQGVGSERVAAVLRGTGNHVRLVVARPANPEDPNAIQPNAPILPSAMLADRDELEKHLVLCSKNEHLFSGTCKARPKLHSSFV